MPVFTANIPKILTVGDQIEIGGKIRDDATKMSINLCAQSGEEPDNVVLHFDVRLQRDNIISLSRKNGVWIGSGNYDTNYNMFEPGCLFRITFEIKDSEVITIYCQGKFHSNFLPKIPLDMARYIVAWGDVEKISFCYFNFSNKQNGSDNPVFVSVKDSVKPAHPIPVVLSPMLPDGTKRCFSIRKKTSPAFQPDAISEETLDEDAVNEKLKNDNRAEKYMYGTLLCQNEQPSYKPIKKPINVARIKYHPEYKHSGRENLTDTEKIDSETEIDSKNLESSSADTDKKANRSKTKSPFNHVVSFIGKTLHKWEDLKKKLTIDDEISY